MVKPKRIAVVTTGRFHLCDLARELIAIGHDVIFYSLVPPWRTSKFGIPLHRTKWLLPLLGMSAMRVYLAKGDVAKREAMEKLNEDFGEVVCSVLKPCDLVIGMSGLCNSIGPYAKKAGACLWIERGSRHILSQQEILSKGPSSNVITERVVEREMRDYESADTIVVLSKHCHDSFVAHGVEEAKLFKNPLGVDLKMFFPGPCPTMMPPKIIMTGSWSWQKGCDVLFDAWLSMRREAELWHVGPVSDLVLPKARGFSHFDRVDQGKLRSFYESCSVFALASRQEGMATVQPQALACGLRLVCTDRTGGEDLREMIADKSAISVVPVDDVAAFSGSLDEAIKESLDDHGKRNRLTENERQELSWHGCARRYSLEIDRRL